MQPGRQYYLIQHEHDKNELYRVVSEFRDEDIVGYTKENRRVRAKIFRRPESVFAKWMEDSAEVVDKCIQHDNQYWKLSKFIKEKTDYENTLAVLKENFGTLK